MAHQPDSGKLQHEGFACHCVNTNLLTPRTDLNSIDQNVNSLDERVPAYSIDDRFSDVEEELDSIEEFVDNLKTASE